MIHDERDVIVAPEVAEQLALALPNARLHVVAGAGHVPTLSHAREVVDVIEDWAAELDRA